VSASLPLSVVEAAIRSILSRNNYGLDPPQGGGKLPASLYVWRWEVKEEHRGWLPKAAREKADGRLAERVQVGIIPFVGPINNAQRIPFFTRQRKTWQLYSSHSPKKNETRYSILKALQNCPLRIRTKIASLPPKQVIRKGRTCHLNNPRNIRKRKPRTQRMMWWAPTPILEASNCTQCSCFMAV
jgi:hypothetical protein